MWRCAYELAEAAADEVIDRDTRIRALDLAEDVAVEVIGLDNWREIWWISPYLTTLTCELISMHLLFKRGHQLTFVPLIKDL
jgi:hypothetical protein